MSDVKTFVFYDKQSGREVFRKRSRQTNFDFDCEDFYSVREDEAIPALENVSERSEFLRKKIKGIIWLRATFALIEDGVEQDYRSGSLAQIPVSAEHQSLFASLMVEERQILEERIASHRARFEAAIFNATDEAQLSKEILLMRKNVMVGIYSPIERERRKFFGRY